MEDAEEGYGDPHEEEESEGDAIQLEEEDVGVSLGTTKGKDIMRGGGSSATATRKRQGASISSVSRGRGTGRGHGGRTGGGRVPTMRSSNMSGSIKNFFPNYTDVGAQSEIHKHLPVCRWLPPDATGCRRRSSKVVTVARHCRTVLPRKSSRQLETTSTRKHHNQYDPIFIDHFDILDSWVEEEPSAILDEDDLDFLNIEGAVEIIDEGEAGGSNGMLVTFHLQQRR
ncbi:hypothetical protein EJ110_NYTH31454 [Nymphaea thermarum]|nr:hypothetical protein EJ110_NYTH31454 [Nymphaea thermarum]